MTSKCGKNKASVSLMSFPQIIFLSTVWRLPWSITEQTHGNMESSRFMQVVFIKKIHTSLIPLDCSGIFASLGINAASYWAAREGNCQRLIEKRLPSMSKNEEIANWTPRKLRESHCYRADFCGEGRVISRHRKSIWNEHKIIAQSNLATTATLGTEESGLCGEVAGMGR